MAEIGVIAPLENPEVLAEFVTAAATILIAATAGIFSFVWRTAQQKRLQTDQDFNRESHNLKLFQALAGEQDSLKLAVASVLIERMRESKKNKNSQSERRSIIRALLSVTKDRGSEGEHDSPVPPELIKLIADGVMNELGIAGIGGLINQKYQPSPLRVYDLQNVRLDGAYLLGLDARGVDLFRASMKECGLRLSNFDKAILKEADFHRSTLDESTFRGSDLRGANFCNASVKGCDFSGANVDGVFWDGVCIDIDTKFDDSLLKSRLMHYVKTS